MKQVTQNNATTDHIHGVALDMDGLLFDTERIYYQVGDILLQRRGHRFSGELQMQMMGRVGLKAMAAMIAFHQLDDEPADLLAESNIVYGELLLDHLRPMPELDRWMQHLIASGVPFGVATSSQRQFVEIILPTTSWHEELHFVLTGDDVTHGKPHPEMYLKAASAMSIDPAAMLVLEDSSIGAASAVAAGAITVAVPNEHTRGSDFDGVRLVADSLGDERLWALLPSRPERS